MNRLLFAMVAALACSGLAFYGGYAAGYASGDAQRNAKWLQAQAQYDRQAKADVLAAQARGDALSTGLLVQQSQIDQLKSERKNAIKVATTGRACLGADALRVLDKSPGITVSGPTQAAGSTAAAGAAPAADTYSGAGIDAAVSTDTDIALWIIDAGAGFEVCRARLDALIDWHQAPQPPQPPQAIQRSP